MIAFLVEHRDQILMSTVEHLGLVGAAMAAAIALGVPLGVLVTRRPGPGRWVLRVADVVQTMPSLAFLGFLVPIPLLGGIGSRPAIVALALYALMPIIRNTSAGITGVDPAVREAARGLGMTQSQILRLVEIPLALGVILAGVRIATVFSIGLATVAAAIGAGGLGTYIFRGIAMVNNGVILAGAVPAALLALLADWLLGRAERALRRRAGSIR
jgi:osmoprotectant transport system permease protein